MTSGITELLSLDIISDQEITSTQDVLQLQQKLLQTVNDFKRMRTEYQDQQLENKEYESALEEEKVELEKDLNKQVLTNKQLSGLFETLKINFNKVETERKELRREVVDLEKDNEKMAN